MENFKRKFLKSNTAITLIALVVTIIVLLILAGISVIALTGENGIINKVQKAKELSEDAKIKEDLKLAYTYALMKKNEGLSAEDIEGQVDIEQRFINNIEDYLEDIYGNVDVVKSEDTYIISIPGIVDYEVDGNGNVKKSVKIIKPVISSKVTQTNGQPIEGDTTYSQVQIEITVSNKDKLEAINNIKLFKGTEEVEAINVNLIDGVATFVIGTNRIYEAKVDAIYDGNNSSNNKRIQVTNINKNDFNRRNVGKIEVVWLDKNNNVIENPNAPVLKITDSNNKEWGLTAVDYDVGEADRWKEVTKPTSSEWYNYRAQNNKVGDSASGTSKWANARAKDGSLFVWIPRYAYKITYYDSSNNILGYSTNEGIMNAAGNVIHPTDLNYATKERVKTQGYTDYIVHPAFTTDADNGGGWENELSGFWIGKFEVNDNNGSVQVVPDKQVVKSKTINQMYQDALLAQYKDSNNNASNDEHNILQSHMIKNSEWGATVYLTHSKYGLNGGNVIKNTTNLSNLESISNVYGDNIYQSSTHNVYGVFNLRGRAAEFVAAYLNNGHSNLETYGRTNASNSSENDLFVSAAGKSTKFKTVFESNSYDGSSNQSADYKLNSWIRGDAVFETSSVNSGTNSWNSEASDYLSEKSVFFKRGGYYFNNSGLFYYYNDNGQADSLIRI